MKNLKKMFTVMAIVAVALFSALTVSAQGNGTTYKYHSLLKIDREGSFTPDEFVSELVYLFTHESRSLEDSPYQLGDDYARDVYSNIINKDFGRNGQALSNQEIVNILLSTKGECMPSDYATNPQYAGRVERYTSDGVVSSWTRDVTPGDQWLVYHNKPFIIVRCGNGYDLTTQEQYNWKRPATQNTVASTTPNVIIYNRNVIESPRPQSVVYRRPTVDPNLQNYAQRNTSCHTGRTILIVAGAAVVVAAVVCILSAKHAQQHDNSYSNQQPYQDTSGQSGATGGSGGSQTWFAKLVPSLSF